MLKNKLGNNLCAVATASFRVFSVIPLAVLNTAKSQTYGGQLNLF